jgi:hypothetical protein
MRLVLDREVVLPGDSIAAWVEREDETTDVARVVRVELLIDEVFPGLPGESITDDRQQTVLVSVPADGAATVPLVVPPEAPASSVAVRWRARASLDWGRRERVVEADLTVLEPKERVASWSGIVDPHDLAWPSGSSTRPLLLQQYKVRGDAVPRGRYIGGAARPEFVAPAESQLEHGAVSIVAEPLLLAPGQRVTGTVSVTPPEAKNIFGVVVAIGYVLAGPEMPSGSIVFSQEHAPIDASFQRGPLSLAAGERRDFPFELELPADVPPTSRSPNTTLRWYLSAWLPEDVPMRKYVWRKGYGGIIPVGVYTAPG